MLFSVIVPVFNVEKYLRECIDSILNQRYEDFDVVLVDDGSTDRSGYICDEYEEKDKRIKVIHKTNGGLSSARNIGIKEAKGEYLVFVDSDDWIEEDSLWAFSKIIEQYHPEIIETTLVEEYPNATIYRDLYFKDYLKNGFNRERAIHWIIGKTENTWPAPKRICRRDFITSNHLYFAEGRLQEDVDWTIKLCCHGRKFQGYYQSWYHYRMKREGSITNVINGKYITDIIEMAANEKQFFNSKDELLDSIFNRMMRSVYICLNQYKNCNKTEQEKVKRCVKNNMWIFDCAPTCKYRFFATMTKMLGVDISFAMLTYIS